MMKVYKVCFDKNYLKELERVPTVYRENIRKKIKELAANPRPEGYLKMKGSGNTPFYRIRCGDYRIVYTIDDDVLIILIIELGHRKEIYRNY